MRVGHLWQSCSMGARCGSCIRIGRVQMMLPRFAGGEMFSESGRATPPCVAERWNWNSVPVWLGADKSWCNVILRIPQNAVARWSILQPGPLAAASTHLCVPQIGSVSTKTKKVYERAPTGVCVLAHTLLTGEIGSVSTKWSVPLSLNKIFTHRPYPPSPPTRPTSSSPSTSNST